MNKQLPLYETLSPWAEADLVSPHGLTVERPDNLEGKSIGLLCNSKRAARPILGVLERELQQRFPKARITWYHDSLINTPEVESPNKEKFEGWLKELDAVIVGYGD